jgi:hypothetical protein
MKTRFLIAAATFSAFGPLAALAAPDSQTDWQFAERQSGERRILSATARGDISGQPVSLSIVCVGGRLAVTLQAPTEWKVQRFTFQFDNGAERNIVDEIKTKDTVMVVEGRPARAFTRGAAQASTVTVTYAAQPESQEVRYDLSGFQAGDGELLTACKEALQ